MIIMAPDVSREGLKFYAWTLFSYSFLFYQPGMVRAASSCSTFAVATFSSYYVYLAEHSYLALIWRKVKVLLRI